MTSTEAIIAAEYEGYADVRDPAPYKPTARRGMYAASPQTRPHLFTDAELKCEIRYLLGLNKRHGSHELRTSAYLRLMRVLEERAAR